MNKDHDKEEMKRHKFAVQYNTDLFTLLNIKHIFSFFQGRLTITKKHNNQVKNNIHRATKGHWEKAYDPFSDGIVKSKPHLHMKRFL